jgi:hypothetical protein
VRIYFPSLSLAVILTCSNHCNRIRKLIIFELPSGKVVLYLILYSSSSSSSSLSSNPFTPCGAWGIHEELSVFAISISLDLIPSS